MIMQVYVSLPTTNKFFFLGGVVVVKDAFTSLVVLHKPHVPPTPLQPRGSGAPRGFLAATQAHLAPLQSQGHTHRRGFSNLCAQTIFYWFGLHKHTETSLKFCHQKK